MDRRMVIVGAGHAGCSAARSLRKSGWSGGIELVNGEDRPPYERPPLSKDVLRGDRPGDAYPLLPSAWLSDVGVSYREGVVAVAIDRTAATVTLSDGTVLPYDKLLLATGADARRLRFAGDGLSGVLTLRSARDVDEIGPLLTAGKRLVVVGGGLIGLETAASARGRGCEVAVVEMGEQLLGRVAPEKIASRIQRLHEANGVSVRLRSQISAAEGDGRVRRAILGDGETLPCDVLLISIGAVANTRLASAAGLQVEGGIVADRQLRTSDPRIFAAGDCCAFHDGIGAHVRREAWKNAEDQGALAARNMIGGSEPYDEISWMWSDQYENVFQSVGDPGRSDGIVVRAVGDETVVLFHLADDGRLLGASAFGAVGPVASHIRAARGMVRQRSTVDARRLADPDVDLRHMASAAVERPFVQAGDVAA